MMKLWDDSQDATISCGFYMNYIVVNDTLDMNRSIPQK